MKLALSTGGGDAPGLNAVIRAVVLAAIQQGWQCYGIRDALNGLLFPEKYAEPIIELTRAKVRGITHLGGTILGTTNRGNPLKMPQTQPDGSVVEVDLSGLAAERLKAQQFDALISIGGDGSLKIANALIQHGIRVIGIPKTIDNDLDHTVTFGFDTAVSFATQCVDRLHNTAESHGRILVVEVMGRHVGWIALHTGLAGTADAILLPEIPYDIQKVAKNIQHRFERGANFAVVVVAEGAYPKGGTYSIISQASAGLVERLGGVAERIGPQLEALTGRETRTVVLGHLLRGGSPTAYDRLLALRLGTAAVRALAAGQAGVMVAMPTTAFQGTELPLVPIANAVARAKSVPLDGDEIKTARQLGIALGD
jgi:phosphofructokinase-like protein